MLRIALLFFALCASIWAEAMPGGYPLRAVYLHTGDLAKAKDKAASLRAVKDVIDDILSCEFTTLFPYANTSSGTAFFRNRYTESIDVDLLGEVARVAKAKRMHLMPAVCVLVQGHDEPAGILLKHPEWALRHANGEPMGWISPAVPEARAWVAAFIARVVEHTKADGVLLDYLRFPNEAVQLDPASAAAFDAAAPPNEAPAARQARLQAFKEEAITALMQLINDTLREGRPYFQIGLYTWGPHVTSDHHVAQPWHQWAMAGYLDRINVSGYCYPKNYGEQYMRVLKDRIQDARSLLSSPRRIDLSIAIGVETSHGALNSAAEFDQYRETAGVEGISVFSWRSLAPWKGDVARRGCFSSGWRGMPPEPYRVNLDVDLGKDQGQNFGTLFELHDERGRLLAAAGFPSAYNTYYRSGRLTLNVFVMPEGEAGQPTITPMPRPSDARHHYLYDLAGTLYATDRKAGTFAWEPRRGEWRASKQGPALEIAGARYALATNRITQGDTEIFAFDTTRGTTGSYYYGAGHLFVHMAAANSPERKTQLHAYAWDPETQSNATTSNPAVLDLTAPGEFPYSYGQLGHEVIVGSNSGGIYRFREGQWSTLRAADPKTSFQIYTMMNHGDRLLMGQYPTGELFAYAGDAVTRLEGWPPRDPAATPNAREAQTIALYRGDLYVGVWPWGEVWRGVGYPVNWQPAARLFSRPAIAPGVNAPYEAEMSALGQPINNLWGQRITTLLPIGTDLIASTANKNGAPYETKLGFLGEDQGTEYGAVYRMHLPGHLAAPLAWSKGKLRLEVVFSEPAIEIRQDGQIVATMPVPLADLIRLHKAKLTLGSGVFGPFQGERIEPVSERNAARTVELAPSAADTHTSGG